MTQRGSTRNASVQVWQAYLNNRTKRARDGRFLVLGQRAIARALETDWPLETLVYRLGTPEPSVWARQVIDSSGVPSVGLVPELMAELAEPAESVPELVAVAVSRHTELEDFAPGSAADPPVVVVIDRPSSALRLGALLRSAAAYGAAGVIVTGSGADHFDPQAVRASDGALFAVPVFRVPGPERVLAFRDALEARGLDPRIVGSDDRGGMALDELDFGGATILVLGDERDTLGSAWAPVCDELVSIPTHGTLGAPSAAAVALYEISRQRRALR
ncbi:RNA methyltransferase [Nocardia otitidiscaviarum]|uniref:TrmH family RNA methyltransferase n=1 Tax=Nocardia otitidiscaviarum TaxID=1823 RepID=UPI0004A72E32|nr:TrmH family RNA methyltransferase [Nocardia otitidiscaviarum]MBF6132472.1 RNA methyltransferase [Nocardia otitidiscaviarum]MBF6488850.1 RNA methyltransferase [Nocardia otitidiscaviarum]